MHQKNVKYGTTKKARRRPAEFKSAADIRQLQKSFKISMSSAQKKADKTVTNANVPSHWTPMPSEKEYQRVPLQVTSSEYKEVETLFKKTMEETTVIKSIERVQNPFMWEKYQRKKQNMKNENEKKLFHGTSPESVETICKKNFDWRLCGKNGTTFGEGSYFALDASYSHKYATVGNDSSQFMFLAKVLAGSYTKGKRAYRTPPPKQPLHPASDLYDSCVDNILNPTIFVTFDIDQCYPEYVIKYSQSIKSIAPRPGLKPTSSLAAVSQLQAPNAHAIRAAASQSSRTSGALTRPPPGISLSYASGLNDTLDIGLSFLSDFASLKSNGHNPYSAPNTSRSQAHRTTTGPNIASSQHHNTTNRPRLQHAQSMPSVIQNRRSSRKKRRCSVM